VRVTKQGERKERSELEVATYISGGLRLVERGVGVAKKRRFQA